MSSSILPAGNGILNEVEQLVASANVDAVEQS